MRAYRKLRRQGAVFNPFFHLAFQGAVLRVQLLGHAKGNQRIGQQVAHRCRLCAACRQSDIAGYIVAYHHCRHAGPRIILVNNGVRFGKVFNQFRREASFPEDFIARGLAFYITFPIGGQSIQTVLVSLLHKLQLLCFAHVRPKGELGLFGHGVFFVAHG